MKTRIISGIAMVPFAALVYFGGWPFCLGVFSISIIGIKEFYDAFRSGTADTDYPVKPFYWFGMGATVLLYAVLFASSSDQLLYVTAYLPIITLFFLLSLLILLFRGGDMQQEAFLVQLGLRVIKNIPDQTVYKKNGVIIFVTLLGFCYIGLFFFHLVLIDRLSGGYRVLIWLVFITAFGTDVMAYFTGYFLGKHKLSPKISPKKTIEGSAGGILGSMLFCGLFGWIVMPGIFIHCIVIGFIGSIFAQLGDLTASIFKRKLGIKDYGTLIPGHGGILDRFDSVLYTAPLVFYYIVIIII